MRSLLEPVTSLVKGFSITLKHLFSRKFTDQYPETPHPIAPKYRGEHKLNKDEQGRVKCVACYLCETNCPAYAIRIKSAPAPAGWADRERYPDEFEVDLLRCIYCGYCEEACPVDAIALTNKVPQVQTDRAAFVLDKERLLANADLPSNGASDQFIDNILKKWKA